MRRLILSLAMLALLCGSALAVEPSEKLADPALEARARDISKELRCLVCQNQSIDDSEADLAHDLRVLVRDRLKVGDTNQQVLDYIVARYGQFVLLRPPFEPATYLLWLAPFAVIVIGGCGIFIALRRRRAGSANGIDPQSLDLEEKSRIAALLDEDRRV